jgi:uncharacterized repeat protein (TIGR03803 family)
MTDPMPRVLLFVLCSSMFATAQNYTVLYNFQGLDMHDGANPSGSLALDKAGNLYGTTTSGGTGPGGTGVGVVFELSPNGGDSWVETVLYSFCQIPGCPDGSNPQGGIVIDSKGNLFGTTTTGGITSSDCFYIGCGVVFELSPPSVRGGAWTESVIYTFCSQINSGVCSDGFQPAGPLVMDLKGNLYGITYDGGNSTSGGTVFELARGSAGWSYIDLYSFCPSGSACLDGKTPVAVTLDSSRNLYGTTTYGGSTYNAGTVFKLTHSSSSWTESVLTAFQPPYTYGYNPASGVTLDSSGNIYGTTFIGGDKGLCGNPPEGCGGAFRLSPNGQLDGIEFNDNDGANPMANLFLKGGKIYGTTGYGGAYSHGNIFEIGPSGKLTNLYDFEYQEGSIPDGNLLYGQGPALYGTTYYGGPEDDGVVYELTP